MEGNGEGTTDASGELLYEGVFPGTYAIDVTAAGFFPGGGEVEVLDENKVALFVCCIPYLHVVDRTMVLVIVTNMLMTTSNDNSSRRYVLMSHLA